MIKEAIIIDGKKISEQLLAELKIKIDADNKLQSKPAKLAIILVGDDPASAIYVRNKIRAAARVGIDTEFKNFDDDISEISLLREIERLNTDEDISGIIVQLPLPKHISKGKVIMAIDPDKDVDGFHPVNVGMLYSPLEHNFVPCTARGCLQLIRSCIDDLSGKNVVVVGRSNIVGRPLAALLLKEHCSVTICHSRTKDLINITKKADVVISAVGSPKFLKKEYFNSEAVVIDVGINRVEFENKYELVGDVDFHEVKNHVKYITPVPGGVGPMTVAYLLLNTYESKLNSDAKKS